MGPINNFARPQIRHVPVPCCPTCHYNINDISLGFVKKTQEPKVIVLTAQLKINRILSSKMLRPFLFRQRRHSWWPSIEATLMLPVGTSWPNKCSDVIRAGVKNEWSRTSTHEYAFTAWWETTLTFFGTLYDLHFSIFYKRSNPFLENKSRINFLKSS